MARVSLLKSLDEISAADAPFIGGKAMNCARLRQAGFPVPDGIVLTTHAMGRSLDIPALREWLDRLPAGVKLAVRSSAVDEDGAEHSFAGIHETRLDVDSAAVAEAVRSCWSSVVSAQAIAYRRVQKLSTRNPKTAVLIQRMIQPSAAGVAFTVNPVTGSQDEIIINSIPGLGEAMAAGLVDPDEFIVRKSDGDILSSKSNDRLSLTDIQVRELASLLKRIEQHYGGPQDVEWCHDGKQFWFVQSRPVTTRPGALKNVTWTRANAREVLPELPSPMTVYATADTIEDAERRFYRKLLSPESETGRTAQVFYGRLYFNVDQIRYACKMSGIAPGVLLRSVGHEGPIDPADEVPPRPTAREFLGALPDLMRMGAKQLLVGRSFKTHEARTARILKELQAKDFQRLPDRDLWEENRKWRPLLSEEMQLVFTLTAVSGYEEPLRSICDRVGMPYDRLAFTYLAAGKKSVSSAQAFDLLLLAKAARAEEKVSRYFAEQRAPFQHYRETLRDTHFLKSFDLFLEQYGHRGRYESDFALPRYVEDPSTLLSTIKVHLEAPEAPDRERIVERQNADAEKAWQEFESRLGSIQRWTLAPVAAWLLRRIKQFYLWRELCRSNIVRIALPIRRLHLELARRFVERSWIESRDDYFFLVLSEVQAAIDNPGSGESLRSIVARRKKQWQEFARLDMPLLMRESDLRAIVRQTPSEVSSIESAVRMKGLCVSPGITEGEVVVLQSPDELSLMKRGAILVTTATDPSWTPLFTLASGIIVEVGGILSHASTVAREYGIPAIANVKGATRILKDGNHVRLDATNGVVDVL
jgi:pyruvate,water dikinase